MFTKQYNFINIDNINHYMSFKFKQEIQLHTHRFLGHTLTDTVEIAAKTKRILSPFSKKPIKLKVDYENRLFCQHIKLGTGL